MQNEPTCLCAVTPYSDCANRVPVHRWPADFPHRTRSGAAGASLQPGLELTKRYAETIVTETDPRHRATQELIREYVSEEFHSEKNGQRPRVLFLVFRGLEAVRKDHGTVGHIVHERTSGRNDSRHLRRLHHR